MYFASAFLMASTYVRSAALPTAPPVHLSIRIAPPAAAKLPPSVSGAARDPIDPTAPANTPRAPEFTIARSTGLPAWICARASRTVEPIVRPAFTPLSTDIPIDPFAPACNSAALVTTSWPFPTSPTTLAPLEFATKLLESPFQSPEEPLGKCIVVVLFLGLYVPVLPLLSRQLKDPSEFLLVISTFGFVG